MSESITADRVGSEVSLFTRGLDDCAHHWLGAHLEEQKGQAGVRFTVWAPRAKRVAVLGDFNDWQGDAHALTRDQVNDTWSLFVPGLKAGDLYKYEIHDDKGDRLPEKSDPFGFSMAQPADGASRVLARTGIDSEDSTWKASRGERIARDAPVSIYEVHLGSWKRRHGEANTYLSYRELAEELVSYVKEMGFTHLQLMPVSEYPFDGSWGYQPVGLFAPTSRFGTTDDFREFVRCCHRAEIGVLIDWVPGHFPDDPHGLGRFDGSALYEHEDPRRGMHPDWNTLIYDYGRGEVASFLLSNANFWLEEYGIDGLRVDAVASMLYLDYSREDGDWLPNEYGGNENLDAIAFIRRLNERLYGSHEGIATIAEESTAWPGVSRPTYADGLGFGYKWNMGWMHDTLRYMSRDAQSRSAHHGDVTFGLHYAFDENFILPLSHDEVSPGKGSLLTRMSGTDSERHANLRAYLAFMWTHPGKKLLFMGGEFAQRREWCHDRGLDWEQLEEPLSRGVQRLVRELNQLYRTTPALYLADCDASGFEWIEADDAEQSVFAFLRHGGGSHTLVVCNFASTSHDHFRVGVPASLSYQESINTDAARFGGGDATNPGELSAEMIGAHGRDCSVALRLPALSTIVLNPLGAPASPVEQSWSSSGNE